MIVEISNQINRMEASHWITYVPHRGDTFWLGVFMGGSLFDTYCKLDNEAETSFYQNIHYMIRQKMLLMIKSHLKQIQMDVLDLKFNEKLKLTSNEATIDEIDKEVFMLHVDVEVCSYGLQLFFYMPHDNRMEEYVVDNSHLFSIKEVITHQNSRMKDPTVVMSRDNKEERRKSILTQFNVYNKGNMIICCFVVSLINFWVLI